MDLNMPIQFGFTQVVLILIALVGLGLLVTAITGLLIRTRKLELLEDEHGNTFKRWRRQRLFRWQRGVSGIILLLLAFFMLWFSFAVQSYLGFTGDLKVGEVRATRVENMPHLLNVELTLLDTEGKRISRKVYSVEGDRWTVQANILELQPWANFLGIHSGYKITRLFGQYDDGTSPKQRQIFLNGDDQEFFRAIENKTWWSNPFVKRAYGNSVTLPPGDYNLYVSQDGIKADPIDR